MLDSTLDTNRPRLVGRGTTNHNIPLRDMAEMFENTLLTPGEKGNHRGF